MRHPLLRVVLCQVAGLVTVVSIAIGVQSAQQRDVVLGEDGVPSRTNAGDHAALMFLSGRAPLCIEQQRVG